MSSHVDIVAGGGGRTKVNNIAKARPLSITGAGVTVTDDPGADTIDIYVPGGTVGSGEANTSSNAGVDGIGIVLPKSGVNLPFKAINVGSTKMTVTDDTLDNTVDLDVTEANLNIANMTGAIGNARITDVAYSKLTSVPSTIVQTNQVNTYTANDQNIPAGNLKLTNSGFSIALTSPVLTVNRTMTIPDTTDTFVGKATSDIFTNKSMDGGSNTFTNLTNAAISATAAIAYSKLNLGSSIVNADIATAAAIAYSKLNLSASILNADISATAAIAYSKLNLSSSIVDADISATAAIAKSKLAALNIGDADTSTFTTTKISTLSKSLLNSAIVYNDQTNTFGAFDQIVPSGNLKLSNSGFNSQFTVGTLAANQVLTFPNTTDNILGRATTDTVSNKTLPIDSNTFKHSTTNAQGDILKYDTTAGKYIRVPIGTGNQVLAVNSGGTDIAWSTSAGGGAPTSSTYVTISSDATLTAERTLAVGTGLTLTDGGANSTVTIDNDIFAITKKKISFYDDFLNGGYTWDFLGSGTGVTYTTTNTNTNAVGEIYPVTGSTSSGSSVLAVGYNVKSIPLGIGTLTIEMRILVPVLSNGTDTFIIRAGLLDSTNSTDATNGVYFEYDQSTDTHWKMCTANGGVRTKTASTQLVTTSYARLKFIVNSAATSITYYYNDTSLGTVTTNIPSGTSKAIEGIMGIYKTVGTTSVGFYCDYFIIDYVLTTSR